jgi:hypothetical protein
MKTRKQKTVVTLLTALVVGTLLAPAFAQPPREQSDDWQYVLTPFFWFAGADGEIKAKGTTSDIDQDFSDIIEVVNIACFGRFEAWKGNIGITANLEYIDLEEDKDTPIGNVEGSMTTFFSELGVSVLLSESPLGSNDSSKLTFEAMGGGRYAYFETGVDITPGPNASKDYSYIEPFIGGRVRLQANENWGFAVRGDIGGFGVGDASELTWTLIAGADLALSETTSLVFGYKILDIEFEKGSGASKRELDLQMSGPAIGLAINL